MVNNINNGGLQGSAAYQKTLQNQQDKSSLTEAKTDNKQVAKDLVALTPQATQLKELQKKIGDTEAFDRKKVEQIKEAISSGQYSINYESLASKLAQFEFEL